MIAGSHQLSLSNPSVTEETSSPMSDLHPFVYLFNFMCVGVLPAYIFVHDLLACVHRIQKRAPGSLELELVTVVSSLVGDGNQTPILRKSNACLTTEPSLQTPGSSPSISLPHTSETYSEMFGKLLAIGFLLTTCLSNSFFSIFSTQLIPKALLMLN